MQTVFHHQMKHWEESWKSTHSKWAVFYLISKHSLNFNFLCLRKQPTFGDATTGFPTKWRLRNKRRNSILMIHHYTDLCSASDWLNQISHMARLEALPRRKHYQDLGSDASSVLNFCVHFSDVIWRETSGSVTKCWLFSQAIISFVFSLLLLLSSLRVFECSYCTANGVWNWNKGINWTEWISQWSSLLIKRKS